jgi:hypothetical protein
MFENPYRSDKKKGRIGIKSEPFGIQNDLTDRENNEA